MESWNSHVLSQQCVLGCIAAGQGGDPAPLLSPHLESFVQLHVPQYKRDLELLEQAQQEVSKVINGVEHLGYEERL